MSETNNVLTDPFERHAEQLLHGVNTANPVLDPAELEIALLSAAPTADDETDFANEITGVTGYARKPLTFKVPGSNDGIVNVEELLWDGNLVTDETTDTASHFAICRKQKMEMLLKGNAGDEQQLWLPSLSVEDLHSGTVTGMGSVNGYFAYDPLPEDPTHVCGHAATLIDSGATFSNTEITQDRFGMPTTYLLITSGPFRGLKIVIWGRLDANTLLLDLAGDFASLSDALTGASYVIRKFPTLASVFGTALETLDIDAGTAPGNGDYIIVNRTVHHGINLRDVTHDRANFKFTFTGESDGVNFLTLDNLAGDDTLNFVDIVFPNDPDLKPVRIFNVTFENNYTELVYSDADNPDLGDAKYVISSAANVRMYKPGYRRSGAFESKFWFNNANTQGTVGWRKGSDMNTDYSDVVLPITDLYFGRSPAQLNNVNTFNFEQESGQSGGSSPNHNKHHNVIGGRENTALFSNLSIEFENNTDSTLTYFATAALASEILWHSEIFDAEGNPNPLPYNANNSINIEAEKIRFYAN